MTHYPTLFSYPLNLRPLRLLIKDTKSRYPALHLCIFYAYLRFFGIFMQLAFHKIIIPDFSLPNQIYPIDSKRLSSNFDRFDYTLPA